MTCARLPGTDGKTAQSKAHERAASRQTKIANSIDLARMPSSPSGSSKQQRVVANTNIKVLKTAAPDTKKTKGSKPKHCTSRLQHSTKQLAKATMTRTMHTW